MAKPITKYTVKKHIIKGKVQSWDRKIFTVEKVGPSEQGVVLQFGRPTRHRVVKLDVKDLPRRDKDGQSAKITWINNFAVVDSRNRFVRRVHYTLFLPALPKGAKFVYIDHRGVLKQDKKPRRRGSKPEQPGMVQVDFTTGDPGGGYK